MAPGSKRQVSVVLPQRSRRESALLSCRFDDFSGRQHQAGRGWETWGGTGTEVDFHPPQAAWPRPAHRGKVGQSELRQSSAERSGSRSATAGTGRAGCDACFEESTSFLSTLKAELFSVVQTGLETALLAGRPHRTRGILALGDFPLPVPPYGEPRVLPMAALEAGLQRRLAAELEAAGQPGAIAPEIESEGCCCDDYGHPNHVSEVAARRRDDVPVDAADPLAHGDGRENRLIGTVREGIVPSRAQLRIAAAGLEPATPGL